MEWQTTTTILERLCAFDDEAAWGRFVERFRAPIIGFARSAGLSHTDAEDVAQETLTGFAEAYRAGQYDREKGRLSRWLFGVAYNHILRHRQSEGRRMAKISPLPGDTSAWAELADEKTASDVWNHEWERHLWQTCMERVRAEFEPQTVAVFEKAMREDARAEQIAGELGVNVKSVYNAKHRVLKRLRELREELEQVT